MGNRIYNEESGSEPCGIRADGPFLRPGEWQKTAGRQGEVERDQKIRRRELFDMKPAQNGLVAAFLRSKRQNG